MSFYTPFATDGGGQSRVCHHILDSRGHLVAWPDLVPRKCKGKMTHTRKTFVRDYILNIYLYILRAGMRKQFVCANDISVFLYCCTVVFKRSLNSAAHSFCAEWPNIIYVVWFGRRLENRTRSSSRRQPDEGKRSGVGKRARCVARNKCKCKRKMNGHDACMRMHRAREAAAVAASTADGSEFVFVCLATE